MSFEQEQTTCFGGVGGFGRRAGGWLWRAGRVAGKHRDRGSDAGAPVTDQFPRPADSGEQRRGQRVADHLRRDDGVRVGDEHDPAGELDTKDEHEQGDQPELASPLSQR